MMILNDKEIIEYVKKYDMISPFEPKKIRFFDVDKERKILSYGLDPFGYTLSLSDEFANVIPSDITNGIIIPNNKDSYSLQEFKADKFALQPKTIVLGKSVEYLKMPPDITGFAYTKSTYARFGVFCNITTIDAGWEGNLVIEIANLSSYPVMIKAFEGIAQIHFIKGKLPHKSYEGNFQKTKKITV